MIASLATISGMDRHTGRALSGREHLHQSIVDILTTPVGSRLANREYGSRLPDLVDAPLNDSGVQAILAATAEAIARWYPAFVLTQVGVTSPEPGTLALTLSGHERGAQSAPPFTLEIPVNSRTERI